MIAKNGQNGHEPTICTDDHHQRQDVRMVEAALLKGWIKPWEVKPEVADAILGRLEKVITESENAALVVKASDIIRKMVSDNLKMAEAVDHSRRLDKGDATEIRHDVQYTVEFDGLDR